jgi:hypothetical protein
VGVVEAYDAVQADVRRVADRLRTAPAQRVERAAPQARAVLQQLADLAAGTDARAADVPPRWREVPALPDIALGDQLDVLGSDLVSVLGPLSAEPDPQVWTRSGRAPLSVLLAQVTDALAALRAEL